MSSPVAFIDDVSGALRTIYGAAANDANTFGLSFEYLDESAAKYAQKRGGELVGMKRVDGAWIENPRAEWAISETTRSETNRLLQDAMGEGWSPQRFASRLEDSGLYGEARAEMIARTEVAIAQNYGQTETYAEAGFTHVIVYDGDCDECQLVDGQTWTIEESLASPIAHPNCVRSFAPADSIN